MHDHSDMEYMNNYARMYFLFFGWINNFIKQRTKTITKKGPGPAHLPNPGKKNHAGIKEMGLGPWIESKEAQATEPWARDLAAILNMKSFPYNKRREIGRNIQHYTINFAKTSQGVLENSRDDWLWISFKDYIAITKLYWICSNPSDRAIVFNFEIKYTERKLIMLVMALRLT